VAQERRERDSQLLSWGDERERERERERINCFLLCNIIISRYYRVMHSERERAKRKCTALMNGELGID
jgi:hypothetical protein